MSHKSYPRISRINQLILEIVAQEIALIDEPELELVSVTGCEVTPDLRYAKVFISVLGSIKMRQQALELLEKKRGRIKRAISGSTHMKFLPDIHFFIDPSIDEGFHIEEIIHEVHERENSLSIRSDGLVDG